MGAKRDITFDLMKGIAILAMLCGHCVIPEFLHHFIYMWHMPLFFMVSGYFFYVKPWKKSLESSIRGLMVPYVITCGIVLIVSLVLSMDISEKVIFGTIGISSAWFGSDAMVGYDGNGPLWFLLALFWCRIIYDALSRMILNKWLFGGAVFCLSVLSVMIGSKYYVPFYLAHGMAALIFYYVGNIAHNMNIEKSECKIWCSLLMLCFVAFGMFIGEPYFYALYFPNWLGNVLAAICASGVIYYICRLCGNNKLMAWLAYVGRMSLLLLSVHGIDYMFSFSKTLVYSRLALEGKIAGLLFDSMLIFIPLLGIVVLPKFSLVRILFNVK